MSNPDFREASQKVNTGILEGNLRHMVDRVSKFKEAIEARKTAGKSRIRTKETVRQEAEAKELEKFIDFCGMFGQFNAGFSKYAGEPGMLSAPKEFRYDIYEWEEVGGKVMQEIRYRNIQLFWPVRILQQVYAWSERKVTLHVI